MILIRRVLASAQLCNAVYDDFYVAYDDFHDGHDDFDDDN